MSTSPLSGKFVLRVSPRLHRKLKSAAEAHALSLNRFCSLQLERASQEASDTPTSSDHDALIASIRSQWGTQLQGIVLFGSAARGEMNAHSDVDLLVVMDGIPSRDLYRRWDKIALKSSTAAEINPQFVQLPSEPMEAGGLWYETALEGIVLWERDRLVHRFLRRIRELMLEGRIQRKMSHGHPYWVKKGPSPGKET